MAIERDIDVALAAQLADMPIDEFRALNLERIRKALKRPVLVDLRNLYDPKKMRDAGFEYSCIGRSAALRKPVTAGAGA